MLAHTLLNLFVGEQCPRRKYRYLIPGTRLLERNHGVLWCNFCTWMHSAGCVHVLLPYFIPTAVSAPEVSRPWELKHVWQTRSISLSPSGSVTPHLPWRYFPQTLHWCEVWRAWRVIGDSFAAPGCCAGHDVSAASCVCNRSTAAVLWHFSDVRFLRKFPKYDKFSPKSILVVPN